jgi:hypothetical protein
MASFATAMPILPGQTEAIRRIQDEALGPRRSEYEESRRRMGITKEMAWVQHTPMGDSAVIYWESENPQRILEQMAQSQEQFDEWFRQFIQNTHGVDITGGDKLLGELPEGSSIRARFTFGCTPYWRKL